jgi:hypothetical protein
MAVVRVIMMAMASMRYFGSGIRCVLATTAGRLGNRGGLLLASATGGRFRRLIVMGGVHGFAARLGFKCLHTPGQTRMGEIHYTLILIWCFVAALRGHMWRFTLGA